MEWILISDKQPENNQEVICWDGEKSVMCTYHDPKRNIPPMENVCVFKKVINKTPKDSYDFGWLSGIKYWMARRF